MSCLSNRIQEALPYAIRTSLVRELYFSQYTLYVPFALFGAIGTEAMLLEKERSLMSSANAAVAVTWCRSA